MSKWGAKLLVLCSPRNVNAMNFFVILLGCCWFSTDRDRQGGRDEYICGQKIHIVQRELKSKRWRQLRRNENRRNFEFVNWCVFGKKIFNILYHDCWSLTNSRCLSVNSVTYLLYYLLTEYRICALKCNFSAGFWGKFIGSLVLVECPIHWQKWIKIFFKKPSFSFFQLPL